MISLSAILHALAPESLSAHLSTFRRDLITNFVEASLLSMRPISLTADPSSLSLLLSSTSPSPLQSLQNLLSFLNSHFFPHLPAAQASFPATLYSPITSAVLTHLLQPSIPSSLPALPSFLSITDEAVLFEDRLLSGGSRNKPIHHWVADVAGHYEKKRRESFLRITREVLSSPEDGSTFKAEVSVNVGDSEIEELDTTAWGFDEEAGRKPQATSTSETTWDQSAHRMSTPEVHEASLQDDEDASDGWGWEDDADGEGDQGKSPSEVQGSDANDPWDDDGWSTEPVSPPQEPKSDSEPVLLAPKAAPKLATRLEKFSAKAKGHGVTSSSTNVSPEVSQVIPITTPQNAASGPLQMQSQVSPTEQEWYLVSLRTRRVLEIVENVMKEGQELSKSRYVARFSNMKNHTDEVPVYLLSMVRKRRQDRDSFLQLLPHLYWICIVRFIQSFIHRC